MKLYHGSPDNIEVIKRSQARAGEGVTVPEDELLDAIYLTADYEYALVMASMPEGRVDIDDKAHMIELENPDLFDPEKKVYIYEIDSETIPQENLKEVGEDGLQFAVLNMSELKPTNKHEHKAGDVEQSYEFKNWKRQPENETLSEFKAK